MGWSIGYNSNWHRDIGYGVPATCDLPSCDDEIDRGLSFLCGDVNEDGGCGLYFCPQHLSYRKPRGAHRSIQLCPRCYAYRPPYDAKPDVPEWINHKLTDESWKTWREENPEKVKELISPPLLVE